MFRFTSRDVLWLMVVVALAVAFGIDRDRLLARLRKAGNVTVDLGASVQQLEPGQVIEVSRNPEGDGFQTRVLNRSAPKENRP